jgi:ABC-type transport system involved in multi-copper enzyme maturation permease subunit
MLKNIKGSWQVLRAIIVNTFRETIRDKVLYSLIAFAALSIIASLLAGSVSLGQDARVIEDFGLMAILVFLLIITIFIGTQLVYREIERRTVYLTLSKPVNRDVFYLGKFLGLALTIALSALIMGLIFVIMLYARTGIFSVAALWAIGFVMLEAWLLTALGLLFSAFTSPLASAVYTFCLVLIGHSSTTIWLLIQKTNSVIIKYVLEAVYFIFPNLEKFNLRNEVVFGFSPDATQVLAVVFYFLGYTLALLILGMAVFRRHEF